MTKKRGFTLIELLVVVGIIALLIAILLPALGRAKLLAHAVSCSSRLRQINIALTGYLNDFNDRMFWRGNDLSIDGMDWYVYGGRETGNLHLGQAGLFNRFQPRPLNPYAARNIELFHCPEDNRTLDWADGNTHFDWVGNSYNFNANGWPKYDSDANYGLAGVLASRVTEPSRTLLFFDAAFVKAPESWHAGKHNICMVDGHVVQAYVHDINNNYLWSPE